MSKLNKDYLLTVFLVISILLSASIQIERAKPPEIEEPDNIVYNKATNTIDLDSLTLKQKIAQMIIAYGKEDNKGILQKMVIGGIYLGAKPAKEDFIGTIAEFQNGAAIPFFVTVDLEGCLNPFENFQRFPALKEIETEQEAYQIGYEEGKLLKEIGVSINFSPVVELSDTIWNCRAFQGTPEEISKKASSYIAGLQENGIIATSKHYPGKTLSVKDPHWNMVYASIGDDDLVPFRNTIKNNVSAVMISHIVVSGTVDSQSKPAVVSEKLVNSLRNQFTMLIITDEINMLGLKSYYNSVDDLYVDLFKGGNDLILNFDTNPVNLYHMIYVIENAVKNGKISEERIDASVARILNAKGINVV